MNRQKVTVEEVFSVKGRGTVFSTRALYPNEVQVGGTIYNPITDAAWEITGVERQGVSKYIGILTRGKPEDFVPGEEWVVNA